MAKPKQPKPNYRRLRKEGWVTHPKALRTIIAIGGLRVGDEVMHRYKLNGMRRWHTPTETLEKQEHVTNYLEYYRDLGLYSRSGYWHFLAWRRPRG